MAISPVATSVASSAPVASHVHSFVDWPAIVAGAVIAAALSFVSISFGSALGLSLTSPYSATGPSPVGFAIGVALWTLWTALSSVIVGAYIAGRLHRRHGNTTPHEVEVRDGAHGLAVWALASLLGVWIASSAVAGAVDTAGRAAAVATNNDPVGYAADSLLRRDDGTPAPGGAQARDQVKAMLVAGGTTGDVSAADRPYLTRVVATQTGLPEAQAQSRVDSVIAARKSAVDKARKSGIIVGFVTAASLLLAAAAAWWAAGLGGRHRDEETVYTGLGGWR